MNSGDLIGLDIGGTTLKAARVGADGVVQRRVTVPAGGRISRDALIGIIENAVADLDGTMAASRIGIAVGSIVRPDGSMPDTATNLANLAGIPLAPLFATRLGRPCTIINDAQAAMYGEAWSGAARDLRDALMVTFGTGIGSGLLLGGVVRRGAHGSAGEIGASRLPGAAGRSIENAASPVSFQRRHGRSLADALLDSSSVAGQTALGIIGRSLAAAHLLLDLEAIVIGGGMSERGEPLRAAIDAAVRKNCPPEMHHGLMVRLSAHGAYAGAIGAVAPTVLGNRS